MKKEYVIVDIDGTVSVTGDRVKHLSETPPDWDQFYERCDEDAAHEDIVRLVMIMHHAGYKIVFCTGRRESVRHKTVQWILHTFGSGFNYHGLMMRANDDTRHDTIVKPEMIQSKLIPSVVEFILEDRNSMVEKWRELGYRVLHVADGDF